MTTSVTCNGKVLDIRRTGGGVHSNVVSEKHIRYSYDDIVGVHRRRYLLRHVALELFLAGGQTILVACSDRRQRDEAVSQLVQRYDHNLFCVVTKNDSSVHRCSAVKAVGGLQGSKSFVDSQVLE